MMRKRSRFRIQDWSVRFKFTVVLLAVAVLPITIVTWQNNVQSRGTLVTSTRQQLAGHSQLVAGTVDELIADRLNSVSLLSSLPGVADYLKNVEAGQRTPFSPDLFTAVNTISHAKSGVALYLNRRGVVVVSNDPSQVNQNYAASEFFQEAYKGTPSVQAPTANGSPAQYVVYYAAPVHDSFGQTVGVAVLRGPASDLQQILQQDANVAGQGSYGILLDQYGIRIANGKAPALNNTAIAPLLAEQQQQLQGEKRFGDDAQAPAVQAAPDLVRLQQSLKGDGSYAIASLHASAADQATDEVAGVRLHDVPWTYVELEPQSAFLAAPNAELQNALFWAGVVAIVVVLLAVFLASKFTQPVAEIAAFLRRVRGGDYGTRLNVGGGDEFGRLAGDVNVTVDRLVQLVQSSEQKDVMQAQIEKLLNEVSAVGEGDLRVEAEVTAGSLGSVADSFNYMIEELRRIIGTVQTTTLEVTTSARQLRQSSEQLAAGSAQQSAQIAEVSDAIVHINSSIQHVAEDAGVSSQVAQTAVTNAQRGGEAVAKTIASMARIRVNVQETAKKVKQLGERSQEIGNIVKLIEDIADKTDLLALNAAIQAEMAGEHGRGFAVLADEVRRLAERATAATKQIATLVKGIQSETQDAVAAMEESTSEVVAGSELADEAGQALLAIDSVMAQLAERIASISSTTAEQATASTQVAETMRDIFRVTTQTHESTQEAVERVSYLDQLASRLRTSVATFKLPEDQAA